MTIRKILVWPDAGLRDVASPVTDFGADFQTLVDDLAETMYAHRGVGLAATQIGVAQHVFVMDCSSAREPDDLRVLVNIDLHETSKEKSLDKEGCLSFPGVVAEVPRHTWVKGKAQDRFGQEFDFHWHGFEAQCVQHESEHLAGRVLVDHLSRLNRRTITQRLKKYKTKHKV